MPEPSTIDADRIAAEWRAARPMKYGQFRELLECLHDALEHIKHGMAVQEMAQLAQDITAQLGELLQDLIDEDTKRIAANGLREASAKEKKEGRQP